MRDALPNASFIAFTDTPIELLKVLYQVLGNETQAFLGAH